MNAGMCTSHGATYPWHIAKCNSVVHRRGPLVFGLHYPVLPDAIALGDVHIPVSLSCVITLLLLNTSCHLPNTYLCFLVQVLPVFQEGKPDTTY